MSSSYDKYDPNVIAQSANEKLAANDLEGGQMIFQSALLDWVDEAREGASGIDPESLKEAIATLWLSYTLYLTQAKKWKSATEAYEQAVSCPVAGDVGRVWLDYARYAEDRNKLRTAQDVYLRALVGKGGDPAAVSDDQDRSLLWNEFLDFMQRTSDPELTLETLQHAVESEHLGARANLPIKQEEEEAPEPIISNPSAVQNNEPPAKRAKLDEPVQQNRTHVVTPEAVDLEAKTVLEELQQNSLPPDIAGAWILRDGDDAARPPEPPLFDPSPPKLSDPTGKELLGLDLALKLNQRLLDQSAGLLLEVCRGLWTLYALKEKEAKDAIDTLDKTMTTENDRLESNLEARLAVAGAARSAVEQMNHNERVAFQNTCSQQRQNVLSGIAWEFRHLLCLQQKILTKINVPGFEGPTIDSNTLALHSKICSYIHSAFYLRNRIGEESHTSMLKSQAIRLEREYQEHLNAQPQSTQYSGTHAPVYNYQTQVYYPPQPQMVGMPSSIRYQGQIMQHPPPYPPQHTYGNQYGQYYQ